MAVAVSRVRVAIVLLVAVACMTFVPAPARAISPGFDGRIVFHRYGSPAQIFTVSPDGTGPTQLTTQGGGFPAFSADGSQIAYLGPDGYSVMDSDGSNQHTVVPVPQAFGYRLSWSPDGSQFMFTRPVNGFSTITIESTDGSSTRQLFADDAYSEFAPTWSPDGAHILFHKVATSPTPVDPSTDGYWISDAGGGNAHRVVASQIGAGYASYSPDGSQIAYQTPGSVAIANVDGTNAHTVTDLGGAPTFSPDGQWIAVAGAWSTPNQGIWVMRADGSDAHQITRGQDDAPDWQPLASAPPNLPPRAYGTAQNLRPLALFGNAGASWDFDGTITRYEWRWGDYSPVSPYKYAWHKYAKAGTYLVRLTVIDNDGATTTKKAWIRVL